MEGCGLLDWGMLRLLEHADGETEGPRSEASGMIAADGGPAFPHSLGGVTSGGMTLRDYFAVHATQPGMEEIAAYAGVTLARATIYFANPIPYVPGCDRPAGGGL